MICEICVSLNAVCIVQRNVFSEYSGMYASMYLILPPQNLLSDGFKLMVNKDYPCVIICQGPSVLNVNYQSGFKKNST